MTDSMFTAQAKKGEHHTDREHHPIITLESLGLISPGDSRAGTPSTITILKMLEPMILPTAISFSPFNAPAMKVASSGKLVPIAITVSPMTNSLTPPPGQ